MAMKLSMFGPTGGTGEQLVRQALAAGHDVIAVARRPEAVSVDHPSLRVVAGDVLDPASLREPVAGADAVLSALGSREGNRPTTVYSAGTAAILTAMRESGVRRFVGLTAAPLIPDEHKTLIERRVLHPLLYHFFGGGYDDMRRMEELVAGSDLDWTVFRPPRLTDKAGSGRYRSTHEAPLRAGRSIPRADLATAMLAAADDPALVGHAVTIAT
jgi:putative NADH-flavin reductase